MSKNYSKLSYLHCGLNLNYIFFTVFHTRLFVNMFPHKRLKWKTCNFHIIQIEFWWYIKERMQRKYNKVNQQQLLKGFACSSSFCSAPETLYFTAWFWRFCKLHYLWIPLLPLWRWWNWWKVVLSLHLSNLQSKHKAYTNIAFVQTDSVCREMWM